MAKIATTPEPASAPKMTPLIIDVNHPGSSAPSSTSKAVMVTNRTMMQDPMVTAADGGDSIMGAPLLDMAPKDHGEPKLPPSQTKIEINPTSNTEPAADKAPSTEKTQAPTPPVTADSIPAAEPEPEPVAETKSQPAAEEAKAKAPPETDTKAAAKSQTPPTTEVADSDDDKTSDSDAPAAPVVDEKQAAAQAAQAAKIAELIKREVYVLPINAVERRRSKQFVVGGLVLIVLLVLVWLDLAADASFIHVPYLPLTHFFRV